MLRHSRAIWVVSTFVSMVTAGACQRPPVSADAGVGAGDTRPQACATFEARSATERLTDVLIVLDASGSMNNTTDDTYCSGGCGATSKWAQVTPALDALVTANDSAVNWGLKMFADADATCGVNNAIAVPVAPANARPIAAAIAARTDANGGLVNGSRTPARAAVTAAANYLAGLGDGNPKQILLLTDGTPNCPASGADPAADDTVAAAQAIADAQARGISTIVVGIAIAGGAADQSLSAMALAGGRARLGATPAYYPLSNIADLKAMLSPVIVAPADCVLALPSPPVGAAAPRIGVRADGAAIPFDADHRAGWDWTDASWSSVELYGVACDDYLAGRIATVTIEFYCGDTT